MAAVVYLATNRCNGKRYIGATGNGLDVRRRQHEQALNTRRATCRYFHAAMKKHGRDAFDWAVLVSCETFADALQQEVRLISEMRPEYNLTPGGQGNSAKRGPLSPERLASFRAKMAARVVSPETREKIAQVHRGRKRPPEVGQKISARRKGIKFTAEHLRNLAIAQTGRKASLETIEKRRQKALGRPCSPEHRERIRATLKGRTRPPEVVAKMLASRALHYAGKREAAYA